MEFKFHISKTANLFQIMDSLSDWALHVGKDLHDHFLSKFSLSQEDKKLLSVYTGIRKQYGWGGLDPVFTLAKSYDDAFKRAKKFTSAKDAKYLKTVFDHFYDRLCSVYHDFRPQLASRKRALESEYKKAKLSSLFDDAAKFYGRSFSPESVGVYLYVFPPKGGHQGGANLRSNNVTYGPANLGDNSKGNLVFDLNILCHEGIHLIEGHEFRMDLEKKLSKYGLDKVDSEVLREAIVDSLAPDGILSIKYGLADNLQKKVESVNETPFEPNDDMKKINRKFREKTWARVYPLSEKQIGSGKKILDGDYLKKAAEELLTVKKKMNEMKKK